LGGGAFETAPGFKVGAQPHDVVAADFDADGHTDVATADFAGNTVTVLHNEGNGVAPAVTVFHAIGSLVPGEPQLGDVVSADFNNDSNPDIAVVNGDGYGLGPFSVSILNGDGAGLFAPAVNYAVGKVPQGEAVADFNGDGWADLAVANANADTVSVLVNQGDGTFQPAKNFASGHAPIAIVAGDFTGDGRPDLVVTNSTNPGTISLLRGTGTGRFRAPVSFDVGLTPKFITVGDFDGNGTLDVALTTGGWVRVLLGTGTGSFQARGLYLIPSGAGHLVTADFNDDGATDIAILGGGNVYVLLGRGDGTFSLSGGSPDGGAQALAVADFNHDGFPDLVVTSPLRVMVGNGDGTFGAPTGLQSTGGVAVASGDFNKDGWPDAVVAQSVDLYAAVATNDRAWPPAPPPGQAAHGLGSAAILATALGADTDIGRTSQGTVRAPAVTSTISDRTAAGTPAPLPAGPDGARTPGPESRLHHRARLRDRGEVLRNERFGPDLGAASLKPEAAGA
jgi:hypothetical protein